MTDFAVGVDVHVYEYFLYRVTKCLPLETDFQIYGLTGHHFCHSIANNEASSFSNFSMFLSQTILILNMSLHYLKKARFIMINYKNNQLDRSQANGFEGSRWPTLKGFSKGFYKKL